MAQPRIIRAGASVEVHLYTSEARNAIYDAALEAIGDVFENNILPEARASSPAGLLPERPGVQHNRESLGIKVFGTKRGPGAKIFSTSGHGGFLEVGTIKMSPQPYIWPAFQTNIGRLMSSIREKIQAIKIEGKQAAQIGRVLPEE